MTEIMTELVKLVWTKAIVPLMGLVYMAVVVSSCYVLFFTGLYVGDTVLGPVGGTPLIRFIVRVMMPWW